MNKAILHQWFNEYIESGEGKGWRKEYEITYNKVQEVRNKIKNGYNLTADKDEIFLSELLKDDRNGVAAKGQSNLANDIFKKIILDRKFIEIIQELILSPNIENYKLLHKYGAQLLKQLGSTNQPLLFNRAYASSTLDVSTVVDGKKFKQLIHLLQTKRIIDFPEALDQKNWYEQNVYLVKKIREVFKEEIENKITDEFQLNMYLWNIYAKKIEGNFNAQSVVNILKKKYPDTYTWTTHIAAFKTPNGRELALDPKSKTPVVICDACPPDELSLVVKKQYSKTDNRHDHLSTHARTLDKGNRAYAVIINNINDLEKFCDWYESDVRQIAIVNNLNEDKKMENIINYQALNRILFGAAGTGKTFNTINHTLSIIENKSLEKLDKENRDELKIRFDKYKKEGKVKFVTFHQSFSYEDFVEGIRAETDDQKKLSYNVKAGVFKEICDLAKSDQLTSLLGTEFGRGYIFKSISSDMLIIQKPNGNLIHLALDLAFLLFESVVQKKITIEDINQKRVLDKLEDNPLLEPYIINGYCAVWANLIQMMVTARELENSQKTPYVLIIDEINRGNISRIFGELITLIEESKRTGAEEELSVTLPYSKQEFTVPSNLYIIGTMNSSDRSLTGLDVALRRRFTFIEMPPRPDLLKDKNEQPIQINAVNQEGENMSVNISELLTVINQRIEVLLDRDHCIGHANFMSLNSQSTVGELAQIFKQKIIPQLQEYFFDDWSKINMVLNGNGMLEAISLERSKIFPNVNTEDMGFFEDQNIWKLAETEFKKIETFIKIIKH